MFLTDEPGYYEDGAFGIRIENVLLVVNKNLKVKHSSHLWLCRWVIARYIVFLFLRKPLIYNTIFRIKFFFSEQF